MPRTSSSRAKSWEARWQAGSAPFGLGNAWLNSLGSRRDVKAPHTGRQLTSSKDDFAPPGGDAVDAETVQFVWVTWMGQLDILAKRFPFVSPRVCPAEIDWLTFNDSADSLPPTRS